MAEILAGHPFLVVPFTFVCWPESRRGAAWARGVWRAQEYCYESPVAVNNDKRKPAQLSRKKNP